MHLGRCSLFVVVVKTSQNELNVDVWFQNTVFLILDRFNQTEDHEAPVVAFLSQEIWIASRIFQSRSCTQPLYASRGY